MITIDVIPQFRNPRVLAQDLRTLVRAVCRRFAVSRARVAVVILGDQPMRRLNRRFTGRRAATDCLSFDLSDTLGPSDPRVLEILVNGEKALREGKARGHGPRAELALYVTHGLLHHLGFDDGTQAETRLMHRMEDEILQDLGYGVVYDRRRTRISTGVR